MNNIVYVLIEQDLQDNETNVIGVADSVENAQKVMDRYYGTYELSNYRYIGNSQLEWEKTIEVDMFLENVSKYKVTLQWFELNKC